MAGIIEVKQYWDDHIIGIDVSDKPSGSKEFFDEIENYHLKKYLNESELLDYNKFKGKKLLEIGCGWGFDLIQFAKGGAEVTGIDLSENSIKLAKKYFESRNVKAILQTGNAENLEFNDNEFDVVVSLGVLHHTPDTRVALGEVYRVLKPSGEALIMLYNKYSWYNLLCKISGTNYENQEKDAPIVKLYSKRQVQKLFNKYSAVKIDISGLPAKTKKRDGFFAILYNNVFVPAAGMIPRSILKQFGFHINISAIK
jgi:ubiquinone/menaquinone biosynthesis C-methylase UbiE